MLIVRIEIESIVGLKSTEGNMQKKYKMVKEGKFYRIISLINMTWGFTDIKKGERGGLIEQESNLSQNDKSWIFEGSMVYENAKVSGNAHIVNDSRVYGHAEIHDQGLVLRNASVFGNAHVFDTAICGENSKVFGNARIYRNASIGGNSEIFGDAHMCGNAKINGDAKVFGDAKISGGVFISGNAMIYGTTIMSGNVQILKNAKINKSSDHFSFGPIGSRDAYMTIFLSDGIIYLSTGCFCGTLEDFEKALQKDRKDYETYLHAVKSSIDVFKKSNS